MSMRNLLLLSRTVSEINGNFGGKLLNFPPTVYNNVPAGEFLLEFCYGVGVKKLG